MFRTFLLAYLCLSTAFSSPLTAQDNTQDISGIVVDALTKEPLPGASISILDNFTDKQTITDLNGGFALNDIPYGRMRIRCDYLGYQEWISPTFYLGPARKGFLEIEMQESAFILERIMIKPGAQDNDALNEMVLISGRSFSVEETERYAGSVADPSRMAVSFAGVQSTNDLDNDIIIRGNSSVGVLWRLEGIDIPNPNHLARRGSSGGAVGIFSVNMLTNSDFIYGAPPAEYGNALSGVFDMRFRKGNKDDHDFALRAGVLGLDLMAEGPIEKGKSSFLANVRYSTLGLLNAAGFHFINERTDNTFSDLAFHLYFPSADNSTIFQVWGIGGLSSEVHYPVENTAEWYEFDHQIYTDFNTRMAASGMSFTHLIDEKSYLKLKLAFMSDHITHYKDTVNTVFEADLLLDESYTTNRMISAFEYSRKMQPHIYVKTGMQIQLYGYNLRCREYERSTRTYINYLDHEEVLGGQQLVQMYMEGSIKPLPRLLVNGGLHLLYLSLSETLSAEPRLSLKYAVSDRSDITVAAGLTSQMVPIGTYFTQENNDKLGLMRSDQMVLGYTVRPGSLYKITVEGYIQRLRHIPVARNTGVQYWMLNDLVGYSKYALVNTGRGRNYGVDLTAERYFENGLFFIVAGSLFRSEYAIGDGPFYSSSYDTRYNTSVMMGKELTLRKSNSLQFGFRNLIFGGQRYKPPDTEATIRLKEYKDDEASSLNRQNKDYFRTDVRLAYRKNMRHRTWTLSLDVQNILNIKNTRGEIWNYHDAVFEDKYQAGIIPVVTFQLNY